MRNTLDPEFIYDAFNRYGFPVLRIDNFDRGNYAKIRAELKYTDFLTVDQLQAVTTNLKLIEKNENLVIQVVNVDMIHKTMRVNISIKE